MKNFLFALAVVFGAHCVSLNAQTKKLVLSIKEENVIERQLQTKFGKFAKLIEDVGTTNSGLSYGEKLQMIKSDAPDLFYEYPDRYMTVIDHQHQKKPDSKKMNRYLRRLLDQSMSKVMVRSYDLELMNYYDEGENNNWPFYKLSSHGDSIFKKTICFKQVYTRVDLFKQRNEKTNYTYSENDVKTMDVFLFKAKVADPKRKLYRSTIKLGDVNAKLRK